jgi:hypothetical protein
MKTSLALQVSLALCLACLGIAEMQHSLFAQIPISRASVQSDVVNAYIRDGLRDNETIKQQGFLLDKSLAALGEARSLFLPNIALGMTYTRAGGGRTIDFPIGDLLNPVYTTLNQLTRSEGFPRLENATILLNPNDFYDAKIRTSAPLYNVEMVLIGSRWKSMLTGNLSHNSTKAALAQCHQFKRKMLFIKRLLVRPQAKRSRGNGG